MSQESKDILIKRFKSFLWRSGNVFAIGLLAFVSDNFSLVGTSPWLITLVGLVTAEVTKWLNTEQQS